MVQNNNKPPQSAAAVVAEFEFYIPLEGIIDFERKKNRLTKELNALDTDLQRLETRLSNPQFRKQAPQDEVQKALTRHTEVLEKKKRLQNHIDAISLT